ncbi:Hypothetical predicted protein [Paramuricea clavata]|uniref:Uncharacterized protein n=1 Tax=Paramuricea clavata TaxID=317549 RepID=A0A7D9J7D0_PARCT|nr:Hypothetical predicted protein [Paramuricea clavata]
MVEKYKKPGERGGQSDRDNRNSYYLIVNVTAKSSIASRKLIIIATSASAGVMFIVMLAVLIVIYKRRTKAANLSIPVDISQEQGYEMAGATDPPFYEEVDAKPDQSQLFRFSKLDENRQAENDNPFQKLSKAEKAPAAEDRSSTYEEVDILSNAHKETGYTVLGVRETTNTSDYQALLKEEPQYEMPATCQPEAYEEVITLPHSSGYTELEKNRQRRKSEDNVYQKLIQRDSGYVIPADTRRESYEDIQPTKIKPGTTSIG